MGGVVDDGCFRYRIPVYCGIEEEACMADRKLFAGHAVRWLRRQAGVTQAAMAEMLAISPSYLNLIERNQRPFSATLLLRLAERFDFDPRVLSGGEPGGGGDAIQIGSAQV